MEKSTYIAIIFRELQPVKSSNERYMEWTSEGRTKEDL